MTTFQPKTVSAVNNTAQPLEGDIIQVFETSENVLTVTTRGIYVFDRSLKSLTLHRVELLEFVGALIHFETNGKWIVAAIDVLHNLVVFDGKDMISCEIPDEVKNVLQVIFLTHHSCLIKYQALVSGNLVTIFCYVDFTNDKNIQTRILNTGSASSSFAIAPMGPFSFATFAKDMKTYGFDANTGDMSKMDSKPFLGDDSDNSGGLGRYLFVKETQDARFFLMYYEHGVVLVEAFPNEPIRFRVRTCLRVKNVNKENRYCVASYSDDRIYLVRKQTDVDHGMEIDTITGIVRCDNPSSFFFSMDNASVYEVIDNKLYLRRAAQSFPVALCKVKIARGSNTLTTLNSDSIFHNGVPTMKSSLSSQHMTVGYLDPDVSTESKSADVLLRSFKSSSDKTGLILDLKDQENITAWELEDKNDMQPQIKVLLSKSLLMQGIIFVTKDRLNSSNYWLLTCEGSLVHGNLMNLKIKTIFTISMMQDMLTEFTSNPGIQGYQLDLPPSEEDRELLFYNKHVQLEWFGTLAALVELKTKNFKSDVFTVKQEIRRLRDKFVKGSV